MKKYLIGLPIFLVTNYLLISFITYFQLCLVHKGYGGQGLPPFQIRFFYKWFLWWQYNETLNRPVLTISFAWTPILISLAITTPIYMVIFRKDMKKLFSRSKLYKKLEENREARKAKSNKARIEQLEAELGEIKKTLKDGNTNNK